MDINELSSDGVRPGRRLVLLAAVVSLGVGTACSTTYDEKLTRVEASGERDVAATNVVKNPADMRHVYVCKKGSDKMQCEPACGNGEIRCPVKETAVDGQTYHRLGRRGLTPTTVSPEARQPGRRGAKAGSTEGGEPESDEKEPSEEEPSSEQEEEQKEGSTDGGDAEAEESKGGEQ